MNHKPKTIVHYIDCPVCGSQQIAPILNAKDYTVSGESFAIWHCSNCTHRFTQEAPDEEAIGKYYQSADYISHSDTKKGIINSLYHRVRKITLKGKLNLVKQVTNKQSGTILDIGCGTGAFIDTMKKAGWTVRGLEPDANARAKAKELYGLDLEPIENFNELPAQQFDAITMWHVLEHVHELHYYIQQLKIYLKPGGKLLIAVPNYTSHDAAHYKEYWAAYDVPRHLYHFSPQSMESLLQQHDLQLTAIKPMWFDSFYVAMLSEKYKNGKGNLLGAFITGCISNLKAMGEKKRCSSLIYVVG
ncbi:MAG: methyltransferase domain-containing protein [Sphingobacteriales bacterium]|nr:methyltransferase domain-containing protein [Sphingobacteriales bacterium]MBI3719596.1 methyltransferase domain-containing protein [Sphingobacteriales bacterium]